MTTATSVEANETVEFDYSTSFDYQLLGRLQRDCEYYLGWGNRAKKHLWAGDETEQIEKMKELYNSLKVKPEWLTMEQIEAYAAQMLPSATSSES